MALSLFVISLGALIIAVIFVVIFVVLTSKWGGKRLEEISSRFDSELDQLKSKNRELKRLEGEISSLRKVKMELIKKKDIQGARKVEDEIGKLQRKKDRVHKYIEDNY